MKRLIVLILSGIVVFGYLSCSKSNPVPYTPPCTNKTAFADSSALISFAGDSIPLTHDSTGLIYHIIDSGNYVRAAPYSVLTVTYVARLMNNSIFDSASNSNLQGAELYQLIPGWQIGMQKIGIGGHIQLFIPSGLAWGCNGIVNQSTGVPVTVVPPDAPVYFDVKLIGIY